MTDLRSVFERLGLLQYLDNFINEGFDSWETVLYITESDLDALSVKLGHRRKLQKEIAHARGIGVDQLISLAVRGAAGDDTLQPDSDARSSPSQSENRNTTIAGSKRKYRRHPKPDENAPERPPSAYVIFSNKVREELRPLKLSFTEIAKTVGERWQVSSPEGKEPYETQAATAKEAYNTEMAKYKRTPQYQEYMQYLTEFKARYAAPSSSTGKRTRLEPQSSTGSAGSGVSMSTLGGRGLEQGKESFGISRRSPTDTSVNSPISTHSATPVSSHQHRFSSSSQGGSPYVRSSDAARPQNLSRTAPLENREAAPRSGLAPIDTKATPTQHPRRSNKSPAILLRHDTSKSSVSSTFSTKSGGSSQMTPLTPNEEPRLPRAPVPLIVQGYPHEPGQHQFLPLAPKPGGSSFTASSSGLISGIPPRAGDNSFKQANATLCDRLRAFVWPKASIRGGL